jgi:hypothetical protein
MIILYKVIDVHNKLEQNLSAKLMSNTENKEYLGNIG